MTTGKSRDVGPDVPHVDARDAEKRAADLREDIEHAREALAGTVAELAYKADVKARVRDRAAAVRRHPKVPLSAALGATLAVLGYLAWWRRRR